ncbi:MAG TPA: hypothetical protein VFE53_04295 [Mucilaginibacter sp.]|jgi:hypothetical protein|nr:hypothetical protein [Mucilaginibacter sp.]
METEKKPVITGGEGGPIKLDEAASWTRNYREKHPGETISQFFGRDILERILAQDGCLGIRFYYALDHAGKKHLVITGVVSDGNDQINEDHFETDAAAPALAAGPATGAADYKIYEIGDQSSPCPGSPGCPHNKLSVGKLTKD